MERQNLSTTEISAQLEEILGSPCFAGADRASRFLRFVVEQTLSGHGSEIKEYALGVEVLGRKSDFDPRLDPIVRAEAGRLRARLLEYYLSAGQHDGIRISIPKGTYIPVFAPNPAPGSTTRARRLFIPAGWQIVVLTAVAVLALAGLAVLNFRPAPLPSAGPAARFLLYPPENTFFDQLGYVGPVQVSPDGQQIAFVAVDMNGKSAIWTRPLNSLTAQVLSGTEDAGWLFWSPNSRFVAFFSRGKLKKVDTHGGYSEELCAAPNPRGGTWNRDDVILFAPDVSSGLYRVSASGGVPEPATLLARHGEAESHAFPKFLPDQRHYLYLSVGKQQKDSAIYAGSLDSNKAVRVLGASTNVTFVPGQGSAPGRLVYVRQNALMAQPFDLQRLAAVGEPAMIASKVAISDAAADFSASDTGVLVYRADAEPLLQMVWVDRQGRQLATLGPPGRYSFPTLSPDEKKVAVQEFASDTGVGDIWIVDVSRGASSRFTFGSPAGEFPVWSPDGKQILFDALLDGESILYAKQASGANEERVLLKSPAPKAATGWSRDGNYVIYEEQNGHAGRHLQILPLHGNDKPFPFRQTKFGEGDGAFSPDGHWIAYSSSESGRDEVYVQRFRDVPSDSRPRGLTDIGKVQISIAGGILPRWRADGRELFFISADKRMMTVGVKADSVSFRAGAPETLFNMRTAAGMSGFPCAFAAGGNGQRFLMTVGAGEGPSVPITVLLNWVPAQETRARRVLP